MSAPATSWGVGEYGLMATRLEKAARAAVELAEIAVSDRVLDVACGTGNAALLAAHSGARVTGLDCEPSLLAEGRARAEASALAVTWVQGDAVELPFPDGTFTVVLSVFGVMYAADQAAAAGELARVCAPGARVALAAWVPGSFMPAMGEVLARYLPPRPRGGPPPAAWGDQQAQASLLVNAGLSIERASRETLTIELADRESAVDFLVRTAGNLLVERESLSRGGRWQEMLADVGAFIDQRDETAGPGVSLGLEYLLTLAAPSRV